ncbi:Senescence regulator S40 [Senna tora]|uniref:Senescence regulator S40 n=1 Tax=Senna tora TaxID=362788 RepID=A0A834T667_9FABA|nr:Senescence regulator S40 [Senna tora]
MEEKYGNLQRQHSGIWRSLRDGDFEEEEVWSVLKEKPEYINGTSGIFKPKNDPLSVPRPIPSASRMIPKPINNNNNTSSSSSIIEAKLFQQSAPLNIPDWSKIYNNNNNKFGDYGFGGDEDGEGNEEVANYGGDFLSGDGDEDEDDEYDPKLPPHEFIARRLARSQISSFSVFEGVGRTLKGRDLSKVRNAILTKTGFLESL